MAEEKVYTVPAAKAAEFDKGAEDVLADFMGIFKTLEPGGQFAALKGAYTALYKVKEEALYLQKQRHKDEIKTIEDERDTWKETAEKWQLKGNK